MLDEMFRARAFKPVLPPPVPLGYPVDLLSGCSAHRWLSGNHGLCGTIPSVLSSDTFLLRTTDDDDSGWTVRPDQTDLGGTCFGMPCCSVAKLIPEFCCVAEQFPDITNKHLHFRLHSSFIRNVVHYSSRNTYIDNNALALLLYALRSSSSTQHVLNIIRMMLCIVGCTHAY